MFLKRKVLFHNLGLKRKRFRERSKVRSEKVWVLFSSHSPAAVSRLGKSDHPCDVSASRMRFRLTVSGWVANTGYRGGWGHPLRARVADISQWWPLYVARRTS